jgi:sugar/nucleoside kinase (ribokinase family)
LRKLCCYASETGKLLGFNLSACFLLQFELANVLFALEHADIVFANEDECLAYYDALKLEEEKDGDHVARRMVAARHIANSKKINHKRDRIVIIS